MLEDFSVLHILHLVGSSVCDVCRFGDRGSIPGIDRNVSAHYYSSVLHLSSEYQAVPPGILKKTV